MINKNLNLTRFSDPYPGLKIENFFDEKFYLQLEKDFPTESQFSAQKNNVKRMSYDTSHGYELYSNLLSKSKAFKEFHDYVYSKEFINYFINLFKTDILKEIENKNLIKNVFDFKLHPEPFEHKIIDHKMLLKSKHTEEFLYPRIDIGIGKEGYGKDDGGRGIHVDNPQRLICLLFFVGGHKKMIGGEHRVWREKNTSINTPTMEEVRAITPAPNLLIGNVNTNKAYHDVNPITYIEGARNAFFMAISASCKIWKSLEDNHFNRLYNRNRTQAYIKPSPLSKIKDTLLRR